MRSMPKEPNFRSLKIMALAKESPTCMWCGALNHGDVVGCHSNSQAMGKGTGHKAHDVPAYLCYQCHALVDGREGHFTREFREDAWRRAALKSIVWLLSEGHLVVT